MMRVAAIVEGYGDVHAIPTLISRTGVEFDTPMIAPDPIKAGEWKKVRKVGELERYLELAYRRSWDKVVLIMDLEDDCCAQEMGIATARINAWRGNRQVDVGLVFLVKEYESIFLSCIEDIVDGHNGLEVPDPESIRDAKGKLKQITGRRYKETIDQEGYTHLINLGHLAQRSRCYRKLVKELTGLSYSDILV